MLNQKRLTVLTISVLLALLFAAVLPLAALADDGVPPTDASAINSPVVGALVVDVLATEEAVSSVEESVTTTPATEEADSPVEDSPAVNESLSVPEVLDAAPEGTNLVVLDEAGQPLALASKTAAITLSTGGNSVWCPDGSTPADGVGGGCTVGHSSFSTLIADLAGNKSTYSGPGTVYVGYDYNAATADDAGSNIVFDYDSLGLYNSLIVQGGWSFSSNTIAGTSTIANTNLTFSDWGNTDGGTLTLNNLVFDGGSLRIEDSDKDSATTSTQADVVLNNVTVTHFTANKDNADNAVQSAGIGIRTTGDIALNNVNASYNISSLEEGSAPAVFAVSTDGDVTANGGSFNNNGLQGLLIGTDTGTATLNNLTATHNEGFGVFGMGGDLLTVNGGQFNNNGMYGLFGGSYGNVILNDVTATGNGMVGAMVIATGDVTVNRGNFSNNDETGVGIQNGGNVTLNNVTAIGNTTSGAGVLSILGNVNVICGEYSGVTMLVGGDVYLGGPVVTGSGVNVFSQGGTITYGQCSKQVVDDNKEQPRETGEGKNIISLPSEPLICDGEKKVPLKIGDAFVDYQNLCDIEFQLKEIPSVSLPGALPDGATQLANLSVELTLDGTPQNTLPNGGKITLKFPVPAGTDAAKLSVMFWNGTEWVKVTGGNVVDEFYTVQVDHPGSYALTTH